MVSTRLAVPLGSLTLRRTSNTLARRPLSNATRCYSSCSTPTTSLSTRRPARASSSVLYAPRLTLQSQRRSLHATSRRSGSSIKTFNLADIGEGITECEIIKWSISPGARVTAFDPLCEVQSDKASVEITSPFDGIVKEILVPEGEIAKVGSGLCLIEVEDEEGAVASSPAAAAASSPGDTTAGLDASSGGVSSSEGAGSSKLQRKHHPLDPSNPNPSRTLGTRPRSLMGSSGSSSSPKPSILRSKDILNLDFNSQDQPLSEPSSSPFVSNTNNEDVLATPQVRHFAKLSGVHDLSVLVPGSGKEGRIEKVDVEAFLESASSASSSAASESVSAQPTVQDKEVVVELGRTRYNMWRAMVKSLEIPHFGYSTTLDITELHNLLPVLNSNIPIHYLPTAMQTQLLEQQQKSRLVNPSALHPIPKPPHVPESGRFTKLTYLPFLVKTLGLAMKEWPLMRSSITPGSVSSSENGKKLKPTLTIRPNSDISLALSTLTGLYTPTLVSSNAHSVYSIASQLKHLSYLGRQVPCALTPKEMPKKGGTITLSNVGAVGKGEVANPVLVEGGGVAICAIGRAKWVWDVEDEFWDSSDEFSSTHNYPYNGKNDPGRGQRRLKLPISWSADHRVVEGAELAAFVECWRGYVEKPGRLVGESV